MRGALGRSRGQVRRRVEGLDVLAREIPHKGGTTFGYRISDGRRAVAYLSDHMPQALGDGPDGWGEYHDAALALAAGVDVLVHDAQYTADEYSAGKQGWGHSTYAEAVKLARAPHVGRLVLYSHDPGHDDEMLRKIEAAAQEQFPGTIAARDGFKVKL